MNLEGVDEISKHMATVKLNTYQRNLLINAGSSSWSSSYSTSELAMASSSPHIDSGAKGNTPARGNMFNCELTIPTLEHSKPAANGQKSPRKKIRKWKLKNNALSTKQPPIEQKIAGAAEVHGCSPPSPPSTASWANFLLAALATPASPPPSSLAHHSYSQPPPKPTATSFNEDTAVIDITAPGLPRLALTPNEKTVGRGRGHAPPRRPTLKFRRRSIGHLSPIHKRARHDDIGSEQF
eukprot:CAMPEP_0181116250 /NCGR_PEP_ID=MMETSP1071-20121207/21850_1 /TAXON_ID=35127 /ORGANISM="Thalassiosira sp., Strain NH16" /LENGTH=237 /DNA_ID=CAMNT_0023200481 /DNA_START=156 /DNA_END=869 /DNA_ORIENTATION=+